jgi:hypothetical protein
VVATVDGRLVTRAEDGTLVERRLTAGGARQLADEVLGAGLVDQDRTISLDLAPGVTRLRTPSACARSGFGQVRVR